MTKNYTDFRNKFRIAELTILETEHWVWSVRPMQPTIGCGVLSMKRPCEAVSDMTEEEGADMTRILKIIEETLKKAFSYDRIHYILYMLEDYHVHYHVLPRYAAPRGFAGVTYEDPTWPKLPALASDPVPAETLQALAAHLRELAAGILLL